jgi:hypothetical protein
MGTTRRILGSAAIVGLFGPMIAAALAKGRIPDDPDELADEMRLAAIYEARRYTSRASRFTGGSALGWYAGVDIDLREATLDPAGGHLDVKAIFGAVRVVVPDAWRVELRPLAFAGGIDDDTDGGAPGSPVLTVKALAAFGAIQVSTRPDESWSGHEPAEAHTNGRASGLEMAEREAAEQAQREGVAANVAEVSAETIEPDAGGPAADVPAETSAEGGTSGPSGSGSRRRKKATTTE